MKITLALISLLLAIDVFAAQQFRLVCQIQVSPSGPQNEFVFTIDEPSQAVNNMPATINDTSIVFTQQNKNEDDAITTFISRVSGVITMNNKRLGTLGSGRCERITSQRQF